MTVYIIIGTIRRQLALSWEKLAILTSLFNSCDPFNHKVASIVSSPCDQTWESYVCTATSFKGGVYTMRKKISIFTCIALHLGFVRENKISCDVCPLPLEIRKGSYIKSSKGFCFCFCFKCNEIVQIIDFKPVRIVVPPMFTLIFYCFFSLVPQTLGISVSPSLSKGI